MLFSAGAGRFGGPGSHMMPGVERAGVRGTGVRGAGFGTVGQAYRILEVADDSPADEAGIEAGYIITGIVGELVPGETVTVSYVENAFQQRAPRSRGGARGDGWDSSDFEREVETTTVVIGEQDGQAYLGVRYVPVGPSGSRGPGGMMGRSGGRGGRGW